MISIVGYIKKNWKVILLCMVFGVLGILFSLVMAEGVHATGDVDFCESCHVMEPMVEAYWEDIHGGKNEHGIRAACTDCHLPHDSVLNYLVVKVISGMKDLRGNFLRDPDKIDWQERREHREHFTYDSGCMGCHRELKNATMSDPKAFKPHRDYFSGISDATCISCHENVGHKDLGLHLK